MPVTNYVWDDENIDLEIDDAGVVQAEYTYEPQQYGNLISEYRGNETYEHHYDALGSTLQLTNSAGTVTDTFVYDAWGEEVARTGTTPTPFRWVGEVGYRWDSEVAAYHVRRRRYLVVIARWLTMDPATLLLPLRYDYVRNNPAFLVDPAGLQNKGSPYRPGCKNPRIAEWEGEDNTHAVKTYSCDEEFENKGHKCTQHVAVEIRARRFGEAYPEENPDCFYTKIYFAFSLTKRKCSGCPDYSLPDNEAKPGRDKAGKRVLIGGIQKECTIGPPTDERGVFVHEKAGVIAVRDRFSWDTCYGPSEGADLVDSFCAAVRLAVPRQRPSEF